MSLIADDIRDAIHEELLEVTSALRPPGSEVGTKFAPDPALIAEVIKQVLIPILTSIVSGIITHLATRDDATEKELKRLGTRLTEMVHHGEPDDELVIEAVVRNITELPIDVAKLGASVETKIGDKVAAELRRFHLAEATSARLASPIVKRVLGLLSATSAK